MRRYRALLRQAVGDLAADPVRPGSRPSDEFGPGVRIYHLRHSRGRVAAADRVRSPRHFVVYRVADPQTLVVGRILHDAMEAARDVMAEDFHP